MKLVLNGSMQLNKCNIDVGQLRKFICENQFLSFHNKLFIITDSYKEQESFCADKSFYSIFIDCIVQRGFNKAWLEKNSIIIK